MDYKEISGLEGLCTFERNPLEDSLDVPVVHTARITYNSFQGEPDFSQKIVHVVGRSPDKSTIYFSHGSRLTKGGECIADPKTSDDASLSSIGRYEILNPNQSASKPISAHLTWKSIGKIIVASTVGVIGLSTGVNFYLHHNVAYETREERVFGKADGVFAHTVLKINKENGAVDIMRHRGLFSGFKNFIGTNGDGDLDRLLIGESIGRGSHMKSARRDRDKNLPIFQEADKEYKQQMERFKPLIDTLSNK